MTTITEAFDLPKADELTAMGFVVRLSDEARAADKLVEEYVVTPTVATALPEIFDELATAVKRSHDYGRFIHGSFGSGKSHFMSLLALLLEDHDAAWAKDDPAIQGLAAQRSWVRSAHPLVVRVHMLSQKGRRSGLDDTLYTAFNKAMARHGKPPASFRDARKVWEDARREAATYGEAFYRQLEDAEIILREDFDALGDADDAELLEDFARAWLEHRGADTSVLDMPWGQGLQRMSAHAQEHGFGTIVFLIDEMLLWLGEKNPHEFRTEVNNLNTIVDHATEKRAVPVMVFVARQRKISDFFPDLANDDELHEYIDHHSKRFQLTTLADVELRHIVKGRVLKPRLVDEVNAAREAMASKHAKVIRGVLADVDGDYLRDVFPFHPALIEMLVDVSALLQRERSALTLLYELLVRHYPDLPLGEFLPVGSAFEAVFPEVGMVEASRKRGDLQRIHQAYWTRLRPALDRQGLPPERRTIVDQVVKTVLLAEVSPKLKQNGLTVGRAVQLNSADTDGHLNRTTYSMVYTDLVELQRAVPDLQVVGTLKAATLTFDLGSVNFGELLVQARSIVGNNEHLKLTTFWDELKPLLGIDSTKGFRPGEGNAGPMDRMWRNTKRKGQLLLGNVRTMKGTDLLCREDFRIVVDYPWDVPGHSVEEDRQRAKNVRQKHGNQYTVCWLPRHLTPEELAVITEIAAARHLQSDHARDELLSRHSASDQATVVERAVAHEQQMRNRLHDILGKVYGEHGECYALENDVTVTAKTFRELDQQLALIADRLMDRRWPAHPRFLTRPDKGKLEVLLTWMIAASDAQGHSVHYDDATGDALRKLAEPMELVDVGQTRATLRTDSRFIKHVLDRSDRASVDWSPIAEHLEANWGFQPEVVNLFLCYLCQAHGFRALDAVTGQPTTVAIGRSVPQVRLQRARLLDHATWSRLRELGPALLGVARPAPHRSVGAQDQAATALHEAAVVRRHALTALHEALVEAGASGTPRTAEVKEALSRLAPLVQDADSFDRVSHWLAAWPDDSEDPVRVAVRAAEAGLAATQSLDSNARKLLDTFTAHAELGAEVQGHLDRLARTLASEERTEALTRTAMDAWNARAHQLLQQAVKPPPLPGLSPGPGPSPTPTPVRPRTKVILEGGVDLHDADAINDLLATLRRELLDSGLGEVKLTVTVGDIRS